jgi:hypothetical protein
MLISMGFQGGCKTTAMGIMPHRDITKAIELSFSLDIPFFNELCFECQYYAVGRAEEYLMETGESRAPSSRNYIPQS